MKNKIIKTVYLLKNEKAKTYREIKKEIEKKFNVSISISKIKLYSNNKKIIKNAKYSEMEKNKLIYLYCHVKNTNKLIKYLNNKYNYKLTKCSLECLASRYNVKKENRYPTSIRQVSDKEKKIIKQRYQEGKSGEKIASMFNYKTRNSIYQILDDLNVKRRASYYNKQANKSYCNFNMKQINTKFKAYFLGLLYTDGYVYNNKNSSQYFIQLSLKDKDVIEFISKTIHCNYFITKNKKKILYRIQLHGEQLVKQVEKYGLVQAKTYNLLPILDNNINFYYLLRGIIDGDGWIRKDGKEFYICSASINFMHWLKTRMEAIGFKNLRIKKRCTKCRGKKYYIYDIRTANKDNINILKKIYDKPFGMMRKYNRVHNIQERPSETIIEGTL